MISVMVEQRHKWAKVDFVQINVFHGAAIRQLQSEQEAVGRGTRVRPNKNVKHVLVTSVLINKAVHSNEACFQREAWTTWHSFLMSSFYTLKPVFRPLMISFLISAHWFLAQPEKPPLVCRWWQETMAASCMCPLIAPHEPCVCPRVRHKLPCYRQIVVKTKSHFQKKWKKNTTKNLHNMRVSARKTPERAHVWCQQMSPSCWARAALWGLSIRAATGWTDHRTLLSW